MQLFKFAQLYFHVLCFICRIQGTLEKYKIDATELNVKVPDLLLRECEHEIQVQICEIFAVVCYHVDHYC